MRRLMVLVFGLILLVAPAASQQAPAGYVVAVALAGDDKTAIVREGNELVPKLMMPLYDGDVILLRDSASRVGIEIGDGDRIDVGGERARYEVKGEIATGDDAWAALSAIVGILGGGESEQIPENMVARGDEGALKLPMAVRGPNYLLRGKPQLWLAWTGGTAPFKLIVEVEGRTKVYDKIHAREFTFEIPAASAKRFEVIVKDAANGLARHTFRLRDRLPELPGPLAMASRGETSRALVLATFLTARHDGDWSVEAAQLLRQRAATDQAAAALLDRIVRGWKLD